MPICDFRGFWRCWTRHPYLALAGEDLACLGVKQSLLHVLGRGDLVAALNRRRDAEMDGFDVVEIEFL